MPQSDRHDLYLTAGAVLLLIAARLIAAALIPISPDETYYFDWSRFPAWSYYDHPPMVAWMIAAGTALFGNGAFGVRAFAVLSAIPTSVALYLTGTALFDKAVALRGVLWVNATLLIGIGGLLATPDAPSVMFWTLAVYALARLAKSGDGRWWLAIGLFAGLGVASKLTNLFLGVGILAALVAIRDLRRWFVSPWLWAGAAVALATLVPMLLWNAGHGWVTLAKQFSRMTSGEFLPEKFPEFIATQFVVLNPFVATFGTLAGAVWIGRRRAYPLAGLDLLLWTALPIVAYMAVHSFHEQIQGHWLAPIFPTLSLAAAAAASAAPGRIWAALRRVTFPAGVVACLAGLVLAVNPGAVLPYTADPLQVIRGWDGVKDDIDTLRRSAGAEWVAGTHYAITGEIAYHFTGTGVPVVPVSERVRYAYAPPPDPALLTKPVLFVTDVADPASLLACLVNPVRVGSIDRRSGKDVIETFAAWRADGATPALFEPGCDSPAPLRTTAAAPG